MRLLSRNYPDRRLSLNRCCADEFDSDFVRHLLPSLGSIVFRWWICAAPLAALGWPRTPEQAQAMPRYPLHFVRCPSCGHVWNPAFCYDHIPYHEQPHRMFNLGSIWQGVLADLADKTVARLPETPTVIEIGCGNGHFLAALAARRPGHYIGFDPHAQAATEAGFEFHPRLFEPFVDMPRYRPQLVVMRHVLEHFEQPAAFIEELAWAASTFEQECWLLAEVPCIDRVFGSGRLADFFYEHPQHFCRTSFVRLLAHGGEQMHIETAYGGEVLIGWLRLEVATEVQARARASEAFAQASIAGRQRIAEQLDALARSGQRVAIWGGTGKAAAFMHHYGADAQRFPLVVDSDPDKVGTHVPGTGQPIERVEVLKAAPVDVIIVPTVWRAHDILAEMRRRGITAKRVLIEDGGQLVEFCCAPQLVLEAR